MISRRHLQSDNFKSDLRLSSILAKLKLYFENHWRLSGYQENEPSLSTNPESALLDGSSFLIIGIWYLTPSRIIHDWVQDSLKLKPCFENHQDLLGVWKMSLRYRLIRSLPSSCHIIGICYLTLSKVSWDWIKDTQSWNSVCKIIQTISVCWEWVLALD
jgi:hypothetical protein